MEGSSSSNSSSSSSSSSSNRWVYLSFCGEDRGKVFTGHLKSALSRKGFDSITHEDKALIEKSRFSIIVFSTNFASSTSRLDEIVEILDCKERKGLFVIPVFYGVDPTHVRKQTGMFGEEFAKHGEDLRMRRWREALVEVTNIAGMHLQNRDEAEFIGKIVGVVSSKFSTTTIVSSNSSDNFFGMNYTRVAVTRLNSYLSTWLADLTFRISIIIIFFFKKFSSCIQWFTNWYSWYPHMIDDS